jgi:type I restriction enzyme R subunit
MPSFISEDQIERALVQKLQYLHGFDVLNCYTENAEDLNDGSGRAHKRDVVLGNHVRQAAQRLNPDIPATAIESALEKLFDRRQAMTLVTANEEIYGLLRDGIPVEFEDMRGVQQQERVRLLDFNIPDNNQFLVVTQLWIYGERGFRRPDVLLYVNGIPLVFIELKNSNVMLRSAFDDNLTNYKAEIPQLFLTNAFCVLTNAIETKVGSVTSEWEHFFNWLRADDEKEKIDRAAIREQGTSLEGIIAGLLSRHRLLDYVENFILYHKGSQKIIAQNHQFIGVNRAYETFLKRDELAGKLGVFWHTQGSGKSFSMIFYARKIFRKQRGSFTFVVVTDRDDLDGQIYRNFLHTGTVSQSEIAQPKNSEEMRTFLGQNKRLVFTLIQKFRWDKGREYPELSPRSDIIVIVDEAHRTQYKSLAENMRKGLPRAQYLAFTGTPLLGRERKTNAWFGGYVSEYNFQQSMDDGATVPLFYEKRVPEVLNQNEELSGEFYEILEDENLDSAQQAKLEWRFAKEVEVIKRDDRLEKIARDIVYHFPRRGYLGKGLVVSVDKFTAVKMFDKVQRLWKEEIRVLRGRIGQSANDIEKARLKQIVEYMRQVEMAVVVSEEADEEAKFVAQGLNIKPHRARMNRLDAHALDIEYNFKAAEHPLQLVFVCAMWLTGFDVPTLSTLYLDKPMQGHTLMQTITRANRVTSWKIKGVEKCNGEIVDYYNVFRNMKLALRDYARGNDDEPPVREKTELFRLLDEAVEQGLAFFDEKEVPLRKVLGENDIFINLGHFNAFADTLLSNDEWRKGFNVYENTVTSLYEACKPEILGTRTQNRVREVAAFQYLRGVIDSLTERKDIDSISLRIAQLLDESVVANDTEEFKTRQYNAEYQVIQRGKTWDLSKINFDGLREEFKEATYKNIEIADLRAFLQHKLQLMLEQNTTRTDFAQRFQKILDAYNSGSSSSDNHYEDLIKFTEDLRAEDERHIREGLSEDELELFDLLKKEKMTQEEIKNVRFAAKSLLHRLLEEHPKVLVQDWFKDTQTQKRVRSAVEQVLDSNLPESYDHVLFREKCDNVFYLMLDYASRGRRWAA